MKMSGRRCGVWMAARAWRRMKRPDGASPTCFRRRQSSPVSPNASRRPRMWTGSALNSPRHTALRLGDGDREDPGEGVGIPPVLDVHRGRHGAGRTVGLEENALAALFDGDGQGPVAEESAAGEGEAGGEGGAEHGDTDGSKHERSSCETYMQGPGRNEQARIGMPSQNGGSRRDDRPGAGPPTAPPPPGTPPLRRPGPPLGRPLDDDDDASGRAVSRSNQVIRWLQ